MISDNMMVLVNPFDSPIPHKKLSQDIERAEAAPDEAIESMYAMHAGLECQGSDKRNREMVLHRFVTALNPAQIDILLHKIITTGPVKGYLTGLFFTRLIQKSYREGNNDFMLTTNDMPLNSLCDRLKGDNPRILAVRMEGNVGDDMCQESSCCSYRINGNCGYNLGSESTNCSYDIHGDTSFGLGDTSDSCKFHVTGNVDNSCGARSRGSDFMIDGNALDVLGYDAIDSSYTVRGMVGRGCGELADECVFKTPNPDTFEAFKRSVEKGCHNKVILTTKRGRILEEVEL